MGKEDKFVKEGIPKDKSAEGRFVLEEVQIDMVQKQKVLGKIAEAVEEKRYMYSPSPWEVFRGQMKYISVFCLGGQMACFVILIALFWCFQKQGEDIVTYLGIGSAVSAYMGVFLILELGRSRDYGMVELEQACYLNLKQVWCVKMILFGCLDILVLTVMVVGISGNTSCGMLQVMVYLLVPFVISNALQLLVFTLLRGGKREYLQMGMAMLASGLSLLPLRYPRWYATAYFGIWVGVLAAALVFLAKEILQVYRKLEEGEVLCWN